MKLTDALSLATLVAVMAALVHASWHGPFQPLARAITSESRFAEPLPEQRPPVPHVYAVQAAEDR